MTSTVTIDAEAIIEARIMGESVRAIAKKFGCSIDDVAFLRSGGLPLIVNAGPPLFSSL